MNNMNYKTIQTHLIKRRIINDDVTVNDPKNIYYKMISLLIGERDV